jgi:hypothetical protein
MQPSNPAARSQSAQGRIRTFNLLILSQTPLPDWATRANKDGSHVALIPCDARTPTKDLLLQGRMRERIGAASLKSSFPATVREHDTTDFRIKFRARSLMAEQSAVNRKTKVRFLPHDQPNEEMLAHTCIICSSKMVERKCKLLCTRCGYFLSCEDYY